jgi:hypothetical protein
MSSTTIWPNDVVADVRELERASPHRLVCFFLSPFDPPAVFDPVHEAVRAVCNVCARSAGIEIECRRADSLHEAKPIHDDIWRHIAGADLLVVDVTGLNPNVMIEFGVAAALRRPAQVILIKSADDSAQLPFNAFAQRYVSYRKSIVGDQDFIGGLQAAMIQAITPAPYVPPARRSAGTSAYFRVDFRDGDRPDLILSPAVTHRRRVNDCLEYGSLFVFRNSWLLLTGADYRNVRVKALFRFGSLTKDPGGAFFGVSLRNHHFLANWGHLAYLRADGVVIRTEPLSDLGEYRDIEEARIAGFDYRAAKIELEAEFTDDRFAFTIGNVEREFKVPDMPYVYGAGKVRLCTSQCRVLVREVELTPL